MKWVYPRVTFQHWKQVNEHGHAELYRGKEEVEEWKKRCPIATLEERLRTEGGLSGKAKSDIEASISKELAEAVAFAEAGPWEPVEDLLKDVLTLE